MTPRRLLAASAAAVAALAVLVTTIGCGPKPPPEIPVIADAPDTDLTGPDFMSDVTASSGVDFSYRNGEDAPHLAILESLGGGLAVLDYDGDGLPDLFLPGGGYYGGPDNKQ